VWKCRACCGKPVETRCLALASRHGQGGETRGKVRVLRLPAVVLLLHTMTACPDDHSICRRLMAMVGAGRSGWRWLAIPWTRPVLAVSAVSRTMMSVTCDPQIQTLREKPERFPQRDDHACEDENPKSRKPPIPSPAAQQHQQTKAAEQRGGGFGDGCHSAGTAQVLPKNCFVGWKSFAEATARRAGDPWVGRIRLGPPTLDYAHTFVYMRIVTIQL